VIPKVIGNGRIAQLTAAPVGGKKLPPPVCLIIKLFAEGKRRTEII